MRRAFTLIEILVVLAIVALAWLWLPTLFTSVAVAQPNRFDVNFPLLHARARMEALARQTSVGFALSADATQMAVVMADPQNEDFVFLTRAPIPVQVVFNSSQSSVAGNPGIYTLISTSTGFWRVWWYGPSGEPLQPGGTLIFNIAGAKHSYTLATAGALLEK